jgi:hypothetical protein
MFWLKISKSISKELILKNYMESGRFQSGRKSCWDFGKLLTLKATTVHFRPWRVACKLLDSKTLLSIGSGPTPLQYHESITLTASPLTLSPIDLARLTFQIVHVDLTLLSDSEFIHACFERSFPIKLFFSHQIAFILKLDG